MLLKKHRIRSLQEVEYFFFSYPETSIYQWIPGLCEINSVLPGHGTDGYFIQVLGWFCCLAIALQTKSETINCHLGAAESGFPTVKTSVIPPQIETKLSAMLPHANEGQPLIHSLLCYFWGNPPLMQVRKGAGKFMRIKQFYLNKETAVWEKCSLGPYWPTNQASRHVATVFCCRLTCV